MLISVVTTSLNHAQFLQQTLDSVRAQHGVKLEHIIVDGASTDGSLELLQALPREEWPHLRWLSERDKGQTQAMNKGIRMAQGDIIGWLNSDDCYREGALASVLDVFERHSDVDVVYGDYAFMDMAGKHMRERREIAFNPLVLFHHFVPHIPTTSTFFRRRIFNNGEWLDETLQYAMDHEFYVRLARRGYKFQHVRKILADFRLHPSSKTCSAAARQLAEARAARQRHTPLIQQIRHPQLQRVCMGALSVAAAVSRYSSKLMQGCYVPDRLYRTVHAEEGRS